MKVRIRIQKRLQAGRGIAIAQASANTIISATGTSTTGGSSYTEGSAVEVVRGSDGKLIKVVQHSTATTPASYPTELKVVDGTKSITMNSTGLVLADSGTGKSFTVAFAALAQNVALRADNYCDGTTEKSQLHLASTPY